jgi:predicted DNA-binding protein
MISGACALQSLSPSRMAEPMTMVRKQIYITPEQDATLKRLAKKRGVTEADVVREAIDKVEADADAAEERRRKAGDELVAHMRRHAATHVGTTDKWTRDDAYDDERSRRLLWR